MEQLPDELVLNVARFLEPRDVAALRGASRRYAEVGADPSVNTVDILDIVPGKPPPPYVRFARVRQRVTRLSEVRPDVAFLTLDPGFEVEAGGGALQLPAPLDLRPLERLEELVVLAPVRILHMPASAHTLAVSSSAMHAVFPSAQVRNNATGETSTGYVVKNGDRAINLANVTALIVIDADYEVPLFSHLGQVHAATLRGFEFSRVQTLRHVSSAGPDSHRSRTMIGSDLNENVIAARITHETRSLIGPTLALVSPCRVLTINVTGGSDNRPVETWRGVRLPGVLIPTAAGLRAGPAWNAGRIELPFLRALALSGSASLFPHFLGAVLEGVATAPPVEALALSGVEPRMVQRLADRIENLKVLFLSKYLEAEAIPLRHAARIVYVDNPTEGLLDFLRKTEFGAALAEIPLVGVPNYGYDFSGWV